MAVLLCFAAGCAPKIVKPQPKPSEHAKTEETASRTALPKPTEPFRIESPPNPSYNGESSFPPPTEEERYYQDILFDICRQSGWKDLDFDPLLTAAARELSRYLAQRQATPPENLLEFVLQWAGVGEVKPEFLYFGTREEVNVENYRAYVTEWVRSIRERRPFNIAGVGVYQLPVKGGGTISYLTVLGIDRELDLDPIRRDVPVENRFYVKGTCRDPGCELDFYLEFLGEHILEAEVPKGGEFSFEVQVPALPAVYRLEITARKRGGRRTITSFPIYNKVSPPKVFHCEPNPPTCEDPTACQNRLHEWINAERTKEKLNELWISDGLTQTAAAHAGEMLKHHYSSILDRKGRDALLRMKDFGVEALQAGEVVDGGYSIESIIERFKNSPSLGRFLNNPALTHLGCGVVPGKDRDGATYHAVSCIVATLIDPREGKNLEMAVFAQFNRLRDESAKPPFNTNARFKPVADRALAALVKDPDKSKLIQERANIEIEELEIKRKRTVFGVLTVYDLAQLGSSSSVTPVIESDLTHLVISVRKITDPQSRYRGIFVYYIAYR